jgi:hypothetical protein
LPSDNEAVEITSGAVTDKVKERRAVPATVPSVASASKVEVVALTDGVPEITPAEDRPSPSGSDPEETRQVWVTPDAPPTDARLCVYGVPRVAPLTVDVVIATVTRIWSSAVADLLLASVTRATNVAFLADDVGVPVMAPDPESESPAGNEPEASDHVYGLVPPLAVNDWLYAESIVAAPRVVVATLTGSPTTICRAEVLDNPFWSRTCSVKDHVPDDVGVPVMSKPLKLRPGGSEPEATDSVFVPVPPVTPMVWE